MKNIHDFTIEEKKQQLISNLEDMFAYTKHEFMKDDITNLMQLAHCIYTNKLDLSNIYIMTAPCDFAKNGIEYPATVRKYNYYSDADMWSTYINEEFKMILDTRDIYLYAIDLRLPSKDPDFMGDGSTLIRGLYLDKSLNIAK